MVTSWPLREGRDGKGEGRNEKCEFLARESVSSSPIVRFFGKGKCKFIANISATMVTSLPSLSLSLSLSLSVSLSLSHRKYLTHNIGSASALPIIEHYVSTQKLGLFEIGLKFRVETSCSIKRLLEEELCCC